MTYHTIEESAHRRVERQRDEARQLAARLALWIEEWRTLQGLPCPLCGHTAWFDGKHEDGCPAMVVKEWFPSEKVGGVE